MAENQLRRTGLALIECGECSGEVSTSAKSCPHCGAPKRKFKRASFSGERVFKTIGALAIFIVVLVVFGGGGSPGTTSNTSVSSSTAKPGATATLTASKGSDEFPGVGDQGKICKAAIGLMFAKDPRIITLNNIRSPFELGYTRAADGADFKYKCKIVGNRVIWAGFVDGQRGRWRDGEFDARVTYVLTDASVKVSEQYGNSKPSVKTFNLSDL